MATVQFVRDEGGFVRISLRGHLGDRFDEYRKAIEGSLYNRIKKANLVTLDKVPGIVSRLREAGFPLSISSEILQDMEAHTAQMWLDVQAAKERAAAFDAQMKEKGKALYPFQFTGITWLSMRDGALLADEMGLGKTLMSLAALPAHAAVLVVAPAVAKGVWRRELALWRPQLKAVVLQGRTSFRWPTKGEVVITNYDILPPTHTTECALSRKSKTVLKGQHTKDCLGAQGNIFIPALQELAKQCKGCLPESSVARECQGCLPFLKDAPEGLVIIADEAHNLKNGGTQRTVRFRSLSQAGRAKGARVWLLTGTPLMNHPMELWAVFQAALLAQEVFGDFKTFLRLFRGKTAPFGKGYVFGEPETEEVAERMQRVMLRRMKLDVLSELPAKTIEVLPVEVDKATLKKCDTLVRLCGGVEAIAADLDKSLAFETMATIRSSLAKAKIAPMMALVEDYEDREEPVVVFSAHRAPIDLFDGRPGWAVITGDTSAEDRTRIEESFQRGELRGVASTIKAGGVAITLTRACFSIFVDQEWNPALNLQAQDRISRIGQTRPCLITILVADHPLDERVTELLLEKQALIDGSVNAAREVPAELSKVGSSDGE